MLQINFIYHILDNYQQLVSIKLIYQQQLLELLDLLIYKYLHHQLNIQYIKLIQRNLQYHIYFNIIYNFEFEKYHLVSYEHIYLPINILLTYNHLYIHYKILQHNHIINNQQHYYNHQNHKQYKVDWQYQLYHNKFHKDNINLILNNDYFHTKYIHPNKILYNY